MQQTLFNLEGATSYTKAKTTLEEVTKKLLRKVQLDELEVLSWTDGTISYHGITKKSKRSVLLTVEKDGTIYANMDGQEQLLVVGKIHM